MVGYECRKDKMEKTLWEQVQEIVRADVERILAEQAEKDAEVKE